MPAGAGCTRSQVATADSRLVKKAMPGLQAQTQRLQLHDKTSAPLKHTTNWMDVEEEKKSKKKTTTLRVFIPLTHVD